MDHYSLALQIIQVFPIVTEPIVLVMPYVWVARTIAGIALIGGTLLVFRAERHRRARALRQPRPAKPAPMAASAPVVQKHGSGKDIEPTETDPWDTEAHQMGQGRCTIEIVIVLRV